MFSFWLICELFTSVLPQEPKLLCIMSLCKNMLCSCLKVCAVILKDKKEVVIFYMCFGDIPRPVSNEIEI